jgi:hypothetical protein
MRIESYDITWKAFLTEYATSFFLEKSNSKAACQWKEYIYNAEVGNNRDKNK